MALAGHAAPTLRCHHFVGTPRDVGLQHGRALAPEIKAEAAPALRELGAALGGVDEARATREFALRCGVMQRRPSYA